jgi:hypothetical protein
VHTWRKELEESFEKRPAIEAEDAKKNQFNIAGENLQRWNSWTKIALDQQNILHWLFVKTATRTKVSRGVFAMDNKISETGESHGGSGKLSV